MIQAAAMYSRRFFFGTATHTPLRIQLLAQFGLSFQQKRRKHIIRYYSMAYGIKIT
jgi:hypothetical protein